MRGPRRSRGSRRRAKNSEPRPPRRARRRREAAVQPEHRQRVERRSRASAERDQPRAEVDRRCGRIGTHARPSARAPESNGGERRCRRRAGSARGSRPRCRRGRADARRSARSWRRRRRSAAPRGRRGEVAVAVEQPIGRERRSGVRGRRPGRHAETLEKAMIRRSISTKLPESGRFDQLVSAVTWKRTSQPLPDCAAVTSGVPSASAAQVRSASAPSGSASTWRLTSDVVGHGQAGERAAARRSSRAAAASCQERLPPRMRSPWRSVHRDQRVGRRGEARAGEADERAALAHPVGDLLLDVGRQRADVGHGDHRGARLDQFRNRHGGVGVARLDGRRRRAGRRGEM